MGAVRKKIDRWRNRISQRADQREEEGRSGTSWATLPIRFHFLRRHFGNFERPLVDWGHVTQNEALSLVQIQRTIFERRITLLIG